MQRYYNFFMGKGVDDERWKGSDIADLCDNIWYQWYWCSTFQIGHAGLLVFGSPGCAVSIISNERLWVYWCPSSSLADSLLAERTVEKNCPWLIKLKLLATQPQRRARKGTLTTTAETVWWMCSISGILWTQTFNTIQFLVMEKCLNIVWMFA